MEGCENCGVTNWYNQLVFKLCLHVTVNGSGLRLIEPLNSVISMSSLLYQISEVWKTHLIDSTRELWVKQGIV